MTRKRSSGNLEIVFARMERSQYVRTLRWGGERHLIPLPNISGLQKGASGKGPRQKTSKIVNKCQNYFRHFLTFFAQGKKCHWETKGRFRKRVVLTNVPSFRFSFRGNMQNVSSFRFSFLNFRHVSTVFARQPVFRLLGGASSQIGTNSQRARGI